MTKILEHYKKIKVKLYAVIIALVNKKKMLYTFKKAWSFFENLGYARAAEKLTRQGFYKEAKVLKLNMKEKEMEKTEHGYNNLLSYYTKCTTLVFFPFMSINFEEE